MTARNAPCPCGSGRKFKQCHGLARPPAHELSGTLQNAQAALARGDVDDSVRLAEHAPAGLPRSRLLAHALITRRADGDLDRARAALRDWSNRAPEDPEPWRRLLEIAFYRNDLEAAEGWLETFSSRGPAGGDAAYYEAVLRQLEGNLEHAIEAYGRAIAARRAAEGAEPLDRPALAVAAAMQACETAAGNHPGSRGRQPEGLFDHPNEAERLEAALLDWETAALETEAGAVSAVAQTHADAWYNLGCAAMAGFEGHERAIRCFHHAVALNPGHLLARTNAVFALNYDHTATPDEIFAAHREAGAWLERQFGGDPPRFANDRSPERRLRIGYLSSDFRQHSVAHFILPVLEAHDRGHFEVFAYHNDRRSDALTQRARAACDTFRPVAQLSDGALHRRIVEDDIDLLVDLNGLTERHRMPVLAMRAAPVQFSWIGYPNTTGLSTVDYRLVDAITDPPGDADAIASESLLRLPRVFSVYAPPTDAPPVGELPFRTNGHVTFGSFNAMPKLNEPLLATWARILRRVPGSRLLIKNVAAGFDAQRRRVVEVFERHGIEAGRVETTGHTTGQREHLAYYHRVDIALDTFPYNGTTTTCESLYMGVPVITRTGFDHRSRVGASQLRAAGVESLLASDENSAIEIAAELAVDTERLAAMRAGLRTRLLSSSLTDARGFTRDLEAALQQAWARWCTREERA